LLAALAIPVAAALANSVRIAEAERLSLTGRSDQVAQRALPCASFWLTRSSAPGATRQNVAALFLDLDDFKRVNDLPRNIWPVRTRLMEVASVILPSVS